VDDDLELLALLRGILENAGYLVKTAATGEEALERAATFLPDLIILDLLLPQINGFTVCEKLRASRAAAATPVIMITTLPGEFPRLEGIEAGCDAYLSKPFEMRELLLRMEGLLNRRLDSPSFEFRAGGAAQKDSRPQS
jgi:two-component system alkaline phosphatase synthesis response regulator PhoP